MLQGIMVQLNNHSFFYHLFTVHCEKLTCPISKMFYQHTADTQAPFRKSPMKSIDHSENKIITQSGLFENETEPGVLQPLVQQTQLTMFEF